ncbi:MAG: pyridoxal phosphate-dependent aminotransferase [Paramuribaculum sp.]|nr:pyridoxal phosphate-dependent aminotransferase [Paramuribaculum sp.]
MDYNFDEIVDRRNTNSYKWDSHRDVPADTLPLWVADMDFRTAPAIVDALRKRVEHGVFGYTYVPDEYYKAVIDWFENRHGIRFKRESIIYTSGVVPAVSAIIKALTQEDDKVIIQTPAYNCFFSSIRNNGCLVAENPLLYDNGRYSIDYEGLESLASDSRCKVLLFCNPHNPSGRVWTKEELQKVADICMRHNVFVISDEIHCEFTFDHHRYIPFASLSPEVALMSATCVSPSKAFNIAGLQIANIISDDSDTRARIDRAININEVCDVNPFGVVATIAAYTQGSDWLEALKDYLWNNYLYLRSRIEPYGDVLKLTPLEGTYLSWLDISSYKIKADVFSDKLLGKEHLMLNPGTMYGAAGEGFVRINLACPRKVLIEAVDRLLTFVAQLSLNFDK